jgi:hypothetical protein
MSFPKAPMYVGTITSPYGETVGWTSDQRTDIEIVELVPPEGFKIKVVDLTPEQEVYGSIEPCSYEVSVVPEDEDENEDEDAEYYTSAEFMRTYREFDSEIKILQDKVKELEHQAEIDLKISDNQSERERELYKKIADLERENSRLAADFKRQEEHLKTAKCIINSMELRLKM